MSTLITAYQPFQGRGVNGSSTLLRWLRRHWPAGQFHSRILPVAWEQAPRHLIQLLETKRPRRYLGIGEGQPGRCAWETVARNQQHGTDETGLHRPAMPIAPQAPPHRHSTWAPPSSHVTSLLPRHMPLVTSVDAGCFLCNRVLWTALEPRYQLTHAAFLHLPPQEDMTDGAYTDLLGPFVLALLLA
jgi:pyrrolidone-carboxylate peptidase